MNLLQQLGLNSMLPRILLSTLLNKVEDVFPGGSTTLQEITESCTSILTDAMTIADKNRNGKLDEQEIATYINHLRTNLPVLINYATEKVLMLIQLKLKQNISVK